MKKSLTKVAFASLFGCSMLPLSAVAQVATGNTAPSTKPNQQIEEVIVTAQHRSENMQRVPIAITAINADKLAARGVSTASALETTIPGLTYSNVAGNGNPRIRGVGTELAGGGNEGAVGTYIDGVYIASASGAMLSFNNISQIAVLKGPQGTLFGRNTTGGVIQITTKNPSQEFGGAADVTVGNLASTGANLYLTGGLTSNIAADVAVHYDNQNQGFGRNLVTGGQINRSQNFSVRGKVLADLGAGTTAIVAADYEKSRSINPAFRPSAPGLGVGGASIDPYATPFHGGTFDINSDLDPVIQAEQWGVAVTVNHQFDFAKLVSITAYRSTDNFVVLDGDAGPFPITVVHTVNPERELSQELRLESAKSDPLEWQVGGYYFYGKGGGDPLDINNGLFKIYTPQQTNSYSAFGQGTYKFTEATSLTLGVRFTDETKTMNGSGFIGLFGGITVPTTRKSVTVDAPTWRVVLSHQLTPSDMIYASYNRGFKSGGFNIGGFTPPGSGLPSPITYFKPEELDAFEIGTKDDLFDHRVRLNAAAFYYDYRNIQLNDFVNGSTNTYNGKSATIYGLDTDLTVRPIDALTLTGGLSLLHAVFGEFGIGCYTNIGAGGLSGPVACSAKGKWLPNTPAYQIDLGADYLIEMGRSSLDLNVSSFWSGKWFGQPENRVYQSAYNLVNASAIWRPRSDGNVSVKFWGKNLGDTLHVEQLVVQNLQPAGAAFDFISLAPGRTFGVTVGVKF